jgi:hypothetical protein
MKNNSIKRRAYSIRISNLQKTSDKRKSRRFLGYMKSIDSKEFDLMIRSTERLLRLKKIKDLQK